MFTHTDQLGNTVRLASRPKRVVSLVPSQSELLWDMGLRTELAGITKFCIHPPVLFKTVQRVGGTKQLHLDKIRALKPDLIIGNKEENERSQVEALQKEFNVWMSDIYSLEDAFDMMQKLSVIFDRPAFAQTVIPDLKRSLASVHNIFSGQRVAYFIWNKPYMLAAKNTFIDHMLHHLGLQNAAGQLRYPEMDEAALQKINPDVCFLSSEPFPFKEKHVQELQAILPHSKIVIVDGEVFSWYGTRLLHLAEYARQLHQIISF